MATQKPIATISYNTESFLVEKLNELINSHTIQAYQYICHIGEGGDKDHIHLRIEPNKGLDPMNLTEFLKEYPIGEEKPRVVRPWRPSKEEDWYLYVVHDPEYLKMKYGGGSDTEKLPYDWQVIRVSDGYDLQDAYTRARHILKRSASSLLFRMKGGENPADLVAEGQSSFDVRNLMYILAQTDYTRLQEENTKLSRDIYDYLALIRGLGYEVKVNENGEKFLVPFEE